MRGIDYAWADPKPPPALLRAAGVTFVVRYLSTDPAKNLTLAEKDGLLAAGIAVAVVWETTAGRMLSGQAGGIADARAAEQMTRELGMDIPVHFAGDQDFSPGDQTKINGYLDGTASVIGHARNGMYGGYWPLRRAFDAGKISYGWQTYAWSRKVDGVDPGPHAVTVRIGPDDYWFDSRAQLRQVLNRTALAGLPGLEVDLDDSMAADFGQWPRPGAGPAATLPPEWTEFGMSKIRVLRQGDADVPGGGFWAVHRLQALLALTGRLNGIAAAQVAANGVFGPETTAAVKAVQKHYGIAADGICGAQTWGVLLTGTA